MKKFLAILMVISIVFAFAACAKKNDSDNKQPESNLAADISSEDNGAASDNATSASDATGALAILNTVWASYADDEKFPAAGGDFSEENSNMEGPGKYSLSDTAAIDASLGIPASAVELVDEAASLTHMMNANTFTCGAYHVANVVDVAPVIESIKENINAREWMCGFPDKLVIITINDYVISAFGAEDIINTFKDKVVAAYSDAQIAVETAITE